MADWESAPVAIDDNTRKFLDFLGKAEGADYNTIVGGKSFDSYAAHPDVVGLRTKDGPSTAAGRYQITKTTYDDVAPKLGINDFSPQSQDLIALELIKRNGALKDVQSGDYQKAISKLGGTWASLPSSPYAQPKRSQGWVEKTVLSMMPSANATDMANVQAKAAPKADDGWESATPAAPKNDARWESATTQAAPAPTVTPEPAPVVTPTPTAASAQTSTQPIERKLTNDTLQNDKTWVSNAKNLYQQVEGKPFKGDDVAASDWLKNYMGQFNWNLAATGKTAYDATNMDVAGKQALLQSIKDYESLPASLQGAGRALKGIATDPTTYAGLGLGSIFTKTVGKEAALEGAKLALQKGIEEATQKSIATKLASKLAPSALTTEAAALGGGSNALNQLAKVNAGGQEQVDLGEVGKNAALAAAGGKVINSAINKVTGRNALEAFGKKAGSEEGARLDAEIIQDLAKISDNPTMRGGKVQAVQANALESKYVNDVQNAIKGFGKENLQKLGVSGQDLNAAVQGRKILTPDELQGLRSNPVGSALADAIEKAQRTRSLTAANPADNNILVKGARVAADWTLPGFLSKPINYMLNNRKSREEVIQGALKNQEAAGKVSEILGPSQATQSLENLQQLAQQAQASRQAQAAQQQAAQAAALAQQAATKNQILQQTRMPAGGGFQELMSGGRSGLNMTSGDAIDALRMVSKAAKGTPVGDAAKQMLQSQPVKDQQAFYGVQNMIRRLSEEGKLPGAAQPGALSELSSGIRNPVSYAANVKNAGEALKVARDAAPSKELTQFANQVGRIKNSADKLKAVEERLAKTTDAAEVEFLNNFVRPLTNFGKGDKPVRIELRGMAN